MKETSFRSWQIEHEDFGAIGFRGPGDRRLTFDRRAVARIQVAAVHHHGAAGNLQPALAVGRQSLRHLLGGLQDGSKKLHVLMNDDGAIAPVGRPHQTQPATLLGIREGFLLIARRDPLPIGYNPNLQKVHRLGLRVVEFAVANAGACRHDLHVARPDHRPGADAVLVLERAFEHVGNDFHVAMPMSPEPLAGADPVFVDHPQRPEAHLLRIVIVAERERVPAVQPPEIGSAAFCSMSYADHSTPRKQILKPQAEQESAYRKPLSALIVSSGRSSRIQWPVSSRTTTVTSEAMSFACAPSATPFALAPPIERTGKASLVLASCATAVGVFGNDAKKANPAAIRPGRAYAWAYARRSASGIERVLSAAKSFQKCSK